MLRKYVYMLPSSFFVFMFAMLCFIHLGITMINNTLVLYIILTNLMMFTILLNASLDGT